MLEVLILAGLLLLSAAFSGTETAFFALGDRELADLRRSGAAEDTHVLRLLGDPPRLLAALLIGNLVVNIVASVLATALLLRLMGPRGVAVAVPAMTVLLLLAGEITPKLMALRLRLPLARVLQAPLRVWLVLIRPLLDLNGLAARVVIARLPGDHAGGRPLSVPELVTAADLAVADAALTETEGRFVSHLLILDGQDVRGIMTPRPDVVALETTLGRAEILERARGTGFNRYPVVESGRELPVGVFHLKDLLAGGEREAPLPDLMREPVFVPESKSVGSLLNELREGRQHMAFVVDEHGDFVGLVTLEDCLEALTGPWHDESDRDDPDVLSVGDNNWIVAGGTQLAQINETCGTSLAPSHDYVTIAGFVMARLGRIPRRGDRLTAGRHRYTVLEMDGHRLMRVRVQRTAPPPAPEDVA